MTNLGDQFCRVALMPIRLGEQHVRSRRFDLMLQAVHPDRLVDALNAAVGTVAQVAGVTPATVEAALPDDAALDVVLPALLSSYTKAFEVWESNQGFFVNFLSGAAGGFLEGYLGIEGIGEIISDVGGGAAKDARLEGPVRQLAADLGQYEQIVRRCGQALDTSPNLSGTIRTARIRRAAVIVSVVAAVGVGAYFAQGHLMQLLRRAAPPAASASAPVAVSPVENLRGRWRTTTGDEIEAVVAGPRARFTPVLVDARSPFAGVGAGFTVSPSTEGPTVFDVEAVVVPALPAGVKLDAAATERCREVWHDLRGKPLKATLEGNTLTVDVVKIDVNATGLDIQGAKVVGCKKLDPARASKVQLSLNRTGGS